MVNVLMNSHLPFFPDYAFSSKIIKIVRLLFATVNLMS